MNDGTHRPGRIHDRIRAPAAALAVAGALLAPAARAADTGVRIVDGITPHLDAVLDDPAVIREIRRWGMSPADVQHDIDTMTVADRARLAFLLTRSWPVNERFGTAAQQAQFLVTMSLLRESTLFASIVTRNPSVLR